MNTDIHVNVITLPAPLLTHDMVSSLEEVGVSLSKSTMNVTRYKPPVTLKTKKVILRFYQKETIIPFLVELLQFLSSSHLQD